MDHHGILKKTENYVTDLFEKNQQEALAFHNLDHTRNVIARAKEIAAQYNLPERDLSVLFIAAWFHDTGHLFVEPDVHEERSIELMKAFIAGQVTNSEDLASGAEKCILATRVPFDPKSLLEQIICDADTYHIGTKEFKSTNKQLKKEYILRKLVPENVNWNKKTLEFLRAHKYYTSYCQALLEKGKQKNIEKLEEKIEENEGNSKEEIKQNASLLNKGIQTMLRLTSANHLRLSEMADRKANILISVNSIIISVILTVLVRRLDMDRYLIFPTVVFLLFTLGTIVISIMATRPKVSGGFFSKEDILNKKTNLLFFGNFHKASLQEYEWGMREMMKDQDYLYGTLIKDIYFLGVVLGKKYKLLRLAYIIFMVGIITAVLAFCLAAILNKGGAPGSTAMPL